MATTVASARGPRTHVIIPTAGRDLDLLTSCLRALAAASLDVQLRITIVVCPVSGPLSPAIGTLAPDATVIALPGPFNYARSINVGLREPDDSPYVLLLNDDCRLTKPGDLAALIALLVRERLACIGPWVMQVQSPGDGYPAIRSRGFVATKTPILGCCALWDRRWLARIGELDERFGIGYGFDEADMLFRARNLGGRWGRNDSIVAEHTNHATFGADVLARPLFRENVMRFAEKYPGVHPWGEGPEWDPLPRAPER